MTSAGGGPPVEEARPFPKMTSTLDSMVSSSSLSSEESYDGRVRDGPNFDLGEDSERREGSTSPQSTVHPGDNVFGWSRGGADTGEAEAGSEGGGPVTLTNISQLHTPISPSNEDVHNADQYKHQQPPLVKYATGGMAPFPGVWNYHPITNFQPTVFTMPENEKYRKMMLKKQKRASKKEKNVMNVMKAEDIEGYKDHDDIDTVLKSLGESVEEEKKSKVKKIKEKTEKSKPSNKKDKRKSLENKDPKAEVKEEEEDDDEETPEKEVKVNRNQFVEDDLMSFKQNFYLISTDQTKLKENLRGSEENLLSSPQATFTKVTSKKNRTKKSKDDLVKSFQPPTEQELGQQRSYPPVRSRDQDFERIEKKEAVRPLSSSDNFNAKVEKIVESDSAAFPKLAKDDFPALPGGKQASRTNAEDKNAQNLPCAWAKVVTKASDINIDNTGASNDHDHEDNDDNDGEDDKTVTVINECDDVEAVIDLNVPKLNEETEDSDDDAATVVSESNDTADNIPNCDEDVSANKVEVITTEDEFDRKEANKNSPVVIFSEDVQDWTSSEFSFGFDVNEELVANTNIMEPAATLAEFTMEEGTEAAPAGVGQYWTHDMTSIDTMDNAILSFGAAGPAPVAGPDGAMRPLIVSVPVGVPIPVTGMPFYPNQLVSRPPVLQYPPVYNLPYPHPMSSEEDNDFLAEKIMGAEQNGEDHTISPESGISSSSPLSWQPDSSPSLPAAATKCHLPLASQVSQSLSEWSGHQSDADTEDNSAAAAPGWATQVEEAEEDGDTSTQDSGLASEHSTASASNQKTEKFNFVEIVNFISGSWSVVSEDSNVQVFSVGAN